MIPVSKLSRVSMAGQTGNITMTDQTYDKGKYAFKLENDMGARTIYQNRIGNPQVTVINANQFRFEEKGSNGVTCYGAWGKHTQGCEFEIAPREHIHITNRSVFTLTVHTSNHYTKNDSVVGPNQVAKLTCSANDTECTVDSVTSL
jgi:hypothetical protein